MTRSEMLFKEAARFIPGGVNSPVRAFGSVGETPRFIASAKGAYMTDVDGNTYLDFVGSWGPMILGHSHPAVLDAVLEACREGLSFGAATEREVEMAELICSLVPSIEMVRMVNSGTEAVMSAIRAARGFTGRSKIVKFAGCYHGHSDSMLVKAGSGVMTAGIPDSAGVPEGCTRDTLTAVYNDLQSVEDIFGACGSEIAAVIVEPVAANMGVVPPQPGFLEALRGLCDAYGALLIFDEVITGFRLSAGGAQRHYGVHADLVTYGKIIGGGMPVGAYAGSRKLMEQVSPLGAVYQAGTLSGNPVAMAAGLAQLEILENNPDVYTALERKGKRLQEGLQEIFRKTKVPAQVNRTGSILTVFFSKTPVTGYDQARACDLERFAKWYRGLLEHGIYAAPSQFEAMFLSAAHQEEDIDAILVAAEEVAKTL